MEELNDDAVTYVILLSAFQVVLNCQLELQGTPYLKGNALQKVREAVNILNLHHARSRDKIWKIDPEKAADIMYSIDEISKLIAKGDGVSLAVTASILRRDLDLSRCILKELTDEELKDYKKK
jgi:hypothetical protein